MDIYLTISILILLALLGLVSYLVYRASTIKNITWKTEDVNRKEESQNFIDDVGGRTAFGELSVAEVTPVFQLDGLYGIDSEDDFQKNSALGGSQGVDLGGLMMVSSGTNPYAFSTLRSKRSVRYRPGQGSMARFTAMFPNGHVTGYQQAAGYINQSDMLGVGYNVSNTEFATIRRYNGKAEIYKVTVTVSASGAETFRITLNGVNFDISCTAGTIQHNATQLSNETYIRWIVDIVGADIYFLYNGPPGDLSGLFSVSNQTPGGTMAATGTVIQDGSIPTDLWTYQSEWNMDKLDGKGKSGMKIDPTKMNIFQIDFRWLGAGVIRYAIEDQITGELIPFHIEHFTNQNTTTHLSNPSMRIGYGVVNISGGGTDVVVKGGSIMGAIQGMISKNNIAQAVTNNLSNLASNDTHHILTIKSNRVNENGTIGKLNQREVILETLAIGVLANAGNVATISLYKNANLVDDEDLPMPNDVSFVYVELTKGVSYSVTTGHHKTGSGTLITAFEVTSNSTDNIDLGRYRIILAPLERISIFVTCPAQVSPSVSLTFQEE